MTPTHAISADEARRLLAEDREKQRERRMEILLECLRDGFLTQHQFFAAALELAK